MGEKQPARPRGRGERAGLDREAILRAAGGLAPQDLTMQELALRLGVDRKALHHHVTSRTVLLEMLAEETLRERLAHVRVPEDLDWRDSARAFAFQMREAFDAADKYVEHFRLTPLMTRDTLRAAETVIGRMVAAGFTETIAARGLLSVTTLATGFIREDRIVGDGSTEVEAFRSVVAESAEEFPLLHALDVKGFAGRDETQFRFAIDTVLDGLALALRN